MVDLETSNEELAFKAKQGDSKSLELLIESNMNMVYKLARKYRNCGLSHEDIVGENLEYFYRAILEYDPSKNDDSKFANYAWIVMENNLRSRIVKRQNSKKRKPPTPLISLNLVVDESDFGSDELIDVVADEGWNIGYNKIEHKITLEGLLDDCKKYLKEREYYIFFGIKVQGKQFREIGKELGLSHQRVNQIFKGVMRKIMANLDKRDYLVG